MLSTIATKLLCLYFANLIQKHHIKQRISDSHLCYKAEYLSIITIMEVKLEKTLNSYFKHKFSGGRSTLARIVDTVFFGFIIMLLGYRYFARQRIAWYVSAALGAAAAVLIIIAYRIISSMRFERFIVHERERIRKELVLSRLSILPETDYAKVVESIIKVERIDKRFCMVLSYQNIEEICADEIAKAYRSAVSNGYEKVYVISCSRLSAKAQDFLSANKQIAFIIYTQEKLYEYTKRLFPITDDEIDSVIIERESKKREQRRSKYKDSFAKSRLTPYFLLGGFLLLASLFVRFSLYYRLLAGLCFGMGFTVSMISRGRE